MLVTVLTASVKSVLCKRGDGRRGGEESSETILLTFINLFELKYSAAVKYVYTNVLQVVREIRSLSPPRCHDSAF